MSGGSKRYPYGAVAPTGAPTVAGPHRVRTALVRFARAGACVAAAALVLAACDQQIAAPAAGPRGNGPAFDVGSSGGSAAADSELAALRRLTAPFQDIATAEAAGWNVQLTGCMENPPEGGMGYHYANTAYIDGTADVLQPELLMYEPEQNGRMRLVGVEYIVPFSAVPADAAPPVLFGHEFHRNMDFQIWGLHAWVWKENPNGMFADWNPTVSCRYAP